MSIATVALSPVYEDNLKLACSLAGKYGSWSNDSILIFLTVGGSIIPLRVKESDYGVVDGNILHLVLRLSDLQAITVRTVCGQEFKFHVDRNRNVGYVKQQIAKKGKGFDDLKEQELILDGEELEDKRLIDDICKSNEAVIHLFVRKSAKVQAKAVLKDFEVSIVASASPSPSPSPSPSDENESDAVEKLQKRFQVVALNTVPRSSILEPLLVNPKFILSPVVKQLIDSTFYGIARGHQPIRSSEGSGGAYFMLDSRAQNYVSVFKPTDEEPMAVNNPQGLPLSVDGEGLKKGTRVGEGAFREVAAYILDHPKSGPRSPCSDEKGFAGVPPTLMVKCLHTGFNYAEGCEYSSQSLKIGSLQMFMKNNGSCEDIGPRAFPIDDVHRISVLDIRLANADRHAGNILVQKDDKDGHLVLIPIDHGYCLPENVSVSTLHPIFTK